MILYTALFLLMLSVILELALVVHFRFLQVILERYLFLGIVVSIFLSWVMGFMFGAAGLTVVIAAMGSTLITNAIYKMHLIDKTRKVKSSVSSFFFYVLHPLRARKGVQ